MKQLLAVLSFVAFIFLVVSCTNIIEDYSTRNIITFQAHHEIETKTIMEEDGTVLWGPNEEISVFVTNGTNGGYLFKSQNDTPSQSVDFSGYINSLVGGYDLPQGQFIWAVYPYKESNTCDGKSVTITLPHEQTAVEGSFGIGCYPTIARSSDKNLAFYAIAGGVQFRVSRPGVKSISIRGNNGEVLAGTIQASFGNDGKPFISSIIDAQEEVVIYAPYDAAFLPNKTYQITLLPATLKNGLTINLITDDNKTGCLSSSKPQQIKRGVFGRVGLIDEQIDNWEDIPTTYEGGGTQSGLYLGIIGFNQALYRFGITRIDKNSKSSFDSFIDGLTSKNGTLLYHSVDEALAMLQKAQYPKDLFSASLITFTDGLDQGSAMVIDPYPSDEEYLDILNNKLISASVSGININSYAVGLEGNDVLDRTLFKQNLIKLSNPESNAYEAPNMAAVNTRFQEMAQQLSQTNIRTTYNVKITVPGKASGTRMRFTFDNASSANSSQCYIEGVFNKSNLSLNEVKYYGLNKGPSVIYGTVKSIFVVFEFNEIEPLDDRVISKDYVMHWLSSSSSSTWQPNTEFEAENDVEIEVTQHKQSAVILLDLDCSKSLGSDFSVLKQYAKSFIQTIYNVAYDPNEVIGVTLDKSEVTLYEGNSVTLKATIEPSSATNKEIRWKSSNTDVATVDAEGVVLAVSEGTSIITATTVDGGFTSSCTVNVFNILTLTELGMTFEYVDLGLSVKWGAYNLGANKPEEYGYYYAWGEITPKNSYSWKNYKWGNGDSNKVTKYCTSNQSNYWAGSGTPDDKKTLDIEDDVASVLLGSYWRMPSKAEQDELRNKTNCKWEWTTENGILGYRVTSLKEGFTDKSIFLPAAGYYAGDVYSKGGEAGSYLSNSIVSSYPAAPNAIVFDHYSATYNGSSTWMTRNRGQSIRPVRP